MSFFYQEEQDWSPELLDSTLRYARQNLIKVNVYIKDPYVAKYVTEEKITEMSFVGGVGGILGIFLGFSFVSSAEIFYFIFGKFFPRKLEKVCRRNTPKRPKVVKRASTKRRRIKCGNWVQP